MSLNSEQQSLSDSSNAIRKGDQKKQTGFSSTISMFVTLLGYSLGMSDTWRFPFLVYRNGGGAFLIPFVITIVLCGIPLYFLEYSLANFSGKGPFEMWDISPLFRGVGISIAVAYGIWLVGSSVFRSWLGMFLLDSVKDPLPWTHCNNSWNTPTCRNNFVASVMGNITVFANHAPSSSNVSSTYVSLNNNPSSNVSSFFNASKGMTAAEEYWQYEALGLSSGITDFSPILWKHIVCIFILRVVVAMCLVRSIKSIEKVMYVLTFAPILFLLVVMVRSLTIPGSMDGLYEFFYPDFSKLRNARIWIEAFLMAFYTLGFGWGCIVMMGSHGQFKDNCVRTAILLPICDTLYAITNGAVCFMVLGNMAHSYGVKVYDVINAGLSAGVVSYVSALSILPGPQFWNFTFISVAILCGLDSQIVPMEMCLQVIGEMFPNLYPKYRIHTMVVMSVLVFVLALPTCTGAGGYIFLWLDWYTGTWVGPICAFLELLAVGWFYGIDRFSMDIALMTGKPAPLFYRVTIAIVAPVVVFMIFLTACMDYVPPQYGSYVYPSWARGAGWLVVVCIMAPIVVKAVSVTRQQTGSIWMRIKKSTQFTPTWGPKDPDAVLEFETRRAFHENKTLKDMLYFTMFGHYKDHQVDQTKRELSVLVNK